MDTQTQVVQQDESVVGIIIGAMLIFCLLTFVILIGIF
jgi:hypothetical protein